MSDRDARLARRGRIAALVIAAGGLLAFLAPVLPGWLGLAPRYELLFYLVALAAFFWSLVETWTIWRARAGGDADR